MLLFMLQWVVQVQHACVQTCFLCDYVPAAARVRENQMR